MNSSFRIPREQTDFSEKNYCSYRPSPRLLACLEFQRLPSAKRCLLLCHPIRRSALIAMLKYCDQQVGSAVVFLTCIGKVLGSSLSRTLSNPVWEFLSFYSASPDKSHDKTSIRLQTLHRKSYTIFWCYRIWILSQSSVTTTKALLLPRRLFNLLNKI
jgi:hypothetical protein